MQPVFAMHTMGRGIACSKTDNKKEIDQTLGEGLCKIFEGERGLIKVAVEIGGKTRMFNISVTDEIREGEEYNLKVVALRFSS